MNNSFVELYKRLLQIDLFGTAGEDLPSNATSLAKAITAGELLLPRAYADGYARPLETNLRRVLQMDAAGRLEEGTVETLTGAVYQHRPDSASAAPLNRFLAVISNLYRSFLDK